jgi:3-carboxy-cis,cis-muconate cycloisomerase
MSLFGPIFVPDALRRAVGDAAWLQAMLDAEAALARAAAPPEVAEAIARCCVASRFDLDELGHAARASGNPVVPLVGALRSAAGDDAAAWVHRGATSQDILDTAAMLVARRALDVIGGELEGVAEACAGLASEHRATLMPARTLLQHCLL